MERLPALHRVPEFAPQVTEQIPSSASLQLPTQKGHWKQGTVCHLSPRTDTKADVFLFFFSLWFKHTCPCKRTSQMLADIRKKKLVIHNSPPKANHIMCAYVLSLQGRGWQARSLKGWCVNISGFADCPISAKDTQLCPCSEKAATVWTPVGMATCQ